MGLKIVIPIGYQRVKKISLTAMPFRGPDSYRDRGYMGVGTDEQKEQ